MTKPLLLLIALAMTACGGAKPQPHGPPPEYEDPPAPAWQADAGAVDSGK